MPCAKHIFTNNCSYKGTMQMIRNNNCTRAYALCDFTQMELILATNGHVNLVPSVLVYITCRLPEYSHLQEHKIRCAVISLIVFTCAITLRSAALICKDQTRSSISHVFLFSHSKEFCSGWRHKAVYFIYSYLSKHR